MKTIKCVNCGNETKIDIANAVDADGEVFRCEHCGYLFRYVSK